MGMSTPWLMTMPSSRPKDWTASSVIFGATYGQVSTYPDIPATTKCHAGKVFREEAGATLCFGLDMKTAETPTSVSVRSAARN